MITLLQANSETDRHLKYLNYLHKVIQADPKFIDPEYEVRNRYLRHIWLPNSKLDYFDSDMFDSLNVIDIFINLGNDQRDNITSVLIQSIDNLLYKKEA